MKIYVMPIADLLTRDPYRSIKAMNRETMEKTINNIYDMGAKDALENAVIDLDTDEYNAGSDKPYALSAAMGDDVFELNGGTDVDFLKKTDELMYINKNEYYKDHDKRRRR